MTWLWGKPPNPSGFFAVHPNELSEKTKIASVFLTWLRAPAYCPGTRGKAIDCRMPQIPAQRVMRRWLVHGRERGKDFCDGHDAGIRYIGQRARAQVGGTAGSRTIHLRRCLGTRTRHFRRAGGSPSPASRALLARTRASIMVRRYPSNWLDTHAAKLRSIIPLCLFT